VRRVCAKPGASVVEEVGSPNEGKRTGSLARVSKRIAAMLLVTALALVITVLVLGLLRWSLGAGGRQGGPARGGRYSRLLQHRRHEATAGLLDRAPAARSSPRATTPTSPAQQRSFPTATVPPRVPTRRARNAAQVITSRQHRRGRVVTSACRRSCQGLPLPRPGRAANHLPQRHVPEGSGRGATFPMVTRLKKDLAAIPKKCTLAYFPHPHFSSGPNGNQTRLGRL